MNGLRLIAPWLPLFVVLVGPMAYGRSVHYIYTDDYLHNLWLVFFPVMACAASALALFVPIRGKTIRRHIEPPRKSSLYRSLVLSIAVSGFMTFWLIQSIPTIADLVGKSSIKATAQVVSLKASGGVLVDIDVIFDSGEIAAIRQHKGGLPKEYDYICATFRTSPVGRVVDSLKEGRCSS